MTFESFPGVELALESLDPRRGASHPELVTVRRVEVEELTREYATVYVPDGKLGYFLRRLNDYVGTADEERGKSRRLVDRIAAIAVTSLEHLWTDPVADFPDRDAVVWWEVWLRRRNGLEIAELAGYAATIDAQLGRFSLRFPDRAVVLLRASAGQLANAVGVLDHLAELRHPRQVTGPLAAESSVGQREWVDELADRLEPAERDSAIVCVLDTGVHQPHPLLAGSLDEADCHAADAAWGTSDHDGHGTEMAGLALLSDLGAALLDSGPIKPAHRLESVKVLPPPPDETPPELYGAVTAAAASRVEIQRPDQARVFSMAITASWETASIEAERSKGEPTSWSATIDALAAGLDVDVTSEGLSVLDDDHVSGRRLFLVSAGNVREDVEDHLTRSDVEPIEDPAQAWNGLTIGACTELTDVTGTPDFAGWTALAPEGELSPFSRTGVPFLRTWPHKPDVVFEGGNLARSPSGDLDVPDSLQVLTTKAPGLDGRLLTVTNATSAATAQAAHLAGAIQASDPSLWPETIRALIVHSARWTPAMEARFAAASSRAEKVALLRRYGFGVPDLVRATRSSTDALTLVVQDVISPFDDEGKMHEMAVHDLPWPREALSDLGEVEVTLRVTLSYFIEPNPARRGWVRRYRYASHGLRFDVRRPTESTDDFRQRINAKARDEEAHRSTSDSDAASWFFGPDQRTAGSLHADFWRGPAAELAERGVVGVYPVSGWWKENKERNHSDRGARYALVVSIETPPEAADVYTPAAAQNVAVESATELEIE